MTEIGGLKITRAYALSETRIMFSTMLSEWDDYESKSIIVEYNHGEPDPWKKAALDIHTETICAFTPDLSKPNFSYFIVMSASGEICHYHPDGPFDEYIFGAEENYDEDKDLGKLNSLRQIGDKLYACGYSGQIYVRDGKNDWRHLTKEILWSVEDFTQDFGEEPEDANSKEHDEWMEKWWDAQQETNQSILLMDIKGVSENEIYICGEEGRTTFGMERNLRIWTPA